ncbi:MAG TPA: sulfate ABC transporter substrate-binding protein [Gemmataceae bacterium]|jgi:sulfate transport system substrate-binding protein|nr:sulfate ABC transporter substrate-binding protein [Gemmataceae bacterium]
MLGKIILGLAAAYVVGAGVWLASGGVVREQAPTELLNVSCDPTRELWKDINERFIDRYEQERGVKLTIKMSHGGSASQARAVIDGLEADVVTLGLWSDTSAVSKRGLIDNGWESRLPYNALPYYSTIVFVVRKGNPKGIHDWPDLIKPGVEVITPNPKTSGNGKLSFLAAWGAELRRTQSEDDARTFVGELYKHVKKLDSGARGATTTFANNGIGDVHLTWENEAYLEMEEFGGVLEIVYPPISIRAEPPMAVVDANVRKKGTRPAAEAYLKFMYSDEAQDVIAKHRYRPSDPAALARNKDKFPPIVLFPITEIAPSWDAANDWFFTEGAEFDRMYSRGRK